MSEREVATRIFLSADLSGSTAFKQGQAATNLYRYHGADNGDPGSEPDDPTDRARKLSWLDIILMFYKKSSELVAKEWERVAGEALRQLHSAPLPNDREFNTVGAPPVLWKRIGDEVVFTKIAHTPKQAYIIVSFWKHVVRKLSRYVLDRTNDVLDVKAAAWSVLLPFPNAGIVISETSDASGAGRQYDYSVQLSDFERRHGGGDSVTLDFLGSSIDLGFRLASAANPRKFVLSAELAAALFEVTAAADRQNSDPKSPNKSGPLSLKIYYDGREHFPGILGGKGYPLFWVDAAFDGSRSDKDKNDKLYKYEDSIRQQERRTVWAADGLEFLSRYLDGSSLLRIPPYFSKGTDVWNELDPRVSQETEFQINRERSRKEIDLQRALVRQRFASTQSETDPDR
jgi:hypothetical protein